MKKTNKKFNKQKIVKELAEQFDSEMSKALQVTVLPNGDAVYKSYVIKLTSLGTWGVYRYKGSELLDQYFLKSCALMAAKAHNSTHLDKYFEIKRLDNCYWANYSDNLIYKKNIKTAKELDRYIVLLNKLEDSEHKANHYKEEISRMFKWSFV